MKAKSVIKVSQWSLNKNATQAFYIETRDITDKHHKSSNEFSGKIISLNKHPLSNNKSFEN